MDPSDYVSSYFRLTNDKITNDETIFIDREGKLIFTTELINDELVIIAERETFTGVNIQTSNVNVIFDSLSLLSTNLNVQNYLPLKLDFGSKPQLEFADPDFNVLTDYKIVVDPAINLDTIRNRRYSRPENICLPFADEGGFIPQNLIDIAVTSRNANDNAPTIHFIFDTDVFPNKIVANYNYQTGQVDLIYTRTFNSQVASNGIWGAVFAPGPAPLRLLNIDDGATIDTYGNDDNAVRVFAIDNTLVSLVQDRNTDLITFYYYIINRAGEFCLSNTLEMGTDFFTEQNVDADYYRGTNIFYILDFEGAIFRVEINRNNELVTTNSGVTFPFGPGPNISSRLFVGGSVINEPNISVFPNVPGGFTEEWYFYPYNQPQNPRIIRLVPSGSDIINCEKIKKFQNYAYVVGSDGVTYFMNLDKGELLKYDTFDNSNNQIVPRSPSAVYLDDNYYIFAGSNDTVDPDTVQATVFNNTRELNKVYNVTYNYSERRIPYQWTSDRFVAKFKLPNNNPIRDMELFKYTLDFRIEYSKTPDKINPARPLSGDKRLTAGERRERERMERERTTEQTLGLVDNEFTLNDFLKVY